MNIVEFSNLTKTYKNNRGIKDITFNIEKGQIFGLLGPNGSGKTTIMKIMTGLIFQNSGRVKIFGYDLEENREEAMRDVGCTIENPSIYTYLTAKQNLDIVKNLYSDCSDANVNHILEQFDLSQYKNEKVKKFSLGMKQKLGLAMTLISNPSFLILDEPSNGLDIEGKADIRSIIRKEAKKGKTILISSHLANEIEEVCTDVAIIRNGELLSVDKVPELMKAYGGIENYYLTLVNSKKEGKI